MSIQIGQTLPHLELSVIDTGKVQSRSSAALFDAPRLVLFGMPGAFTPTCSERHLPGYVRHHEDFLARGIALCGMAVNDAHVMLAWANAKHVPTGLTLIADGDALLTHALGMEMDRSGYGMGMRSRRFALYAEHGIVRQLEVERPGELRVSSAEAMLASIAG